MSKTTKTLKHFGFRLRNFSGVTVEVLDVQKKKNLKEVLSKWLLQHYNRNGGNGSMSWMTELNETAFVFVGWSGLLLFPTAYMAIGGQLTGTTFVTGWYTHGLRVFLP